MSFVGRTSKTELADLLLLLSGQIGVGDLTLLHASGQFVHERETRPRGLFNPVRLRSGEASLEKVGLAYEAVKGGNPAVPVGPLRIVIDGGNQMSTEVVPLAACAFDDENGHRQRSRLPWRVERGRAIGAGKGPLGKAGVDQVVRFHGRATPIMESRVTRPASASSDSASVPSGRIGNTR